MKNFQYAPARDARQAVSLLSTDWEQSRVMGGGTDLLDEMKERLVETERIVHLQPAAFGYIKSTRQHIVIGATTTIASLETNPLIEQKLPGLKQAASSIATPQIRNAATVGGNLCQRPRCWYYRNVEYPCLKKGGSTCYAKEGANKYNAIIGGWAELHRASVRLRSGADGAGCQCAHCGAKRRACRSARCVFRPAAQRCMRENILEPNEVITEIWCRNRQRAAQALT
jgi:xanthine dehydrogenase YagS FAD-binding subunit